MMECRVMIQNLLSVSVVCPMRSRAKYDRFDVPLTYVFIRLYLLSRGSYVGIIRTTELLH